jgi:ribosomal protein L20
MAEQTPDPQIAIPEAQQRHHAALDALADKLDASLTDAERNRPFWNVMQGAMRTMRTDMVGTWQRDLKREPRQVPLDPLRNAQQSLNLLKYDALIVEVNDLNNELDRRRLRLLAIHSSNIVFRFLGRVRVRTLRAAKGVVCIFLRPFGVRMCKGTAQPEDTT